MTQIINGLILSVDRIQNEKFTFQGKEVKFEQDKNNPSIYTARTQLSKEEKEAGNLETAFTFNIGTAEGVLSVYACPPEGDDFKDLNDSEKFTKLNSISYQFNSPEPTDRGNQLDSVLQRSYSENSNTAKAQQSQGIQGQEEQQQQQQKPAATTTPNKAIHIKNADIQDKEEGNNKK